MNRRYINYSRKKFNAWRSRVAKHLPYFATEFYKIPTYIDYDTHKLLGRVISGINDPFYSITNHDGTRTDYQGEMAAEIILELQVNELFAYIQKHKQKP